MKAVVIVVITAALIAVAVVKSSKAKQSDRSELNNVQALPPSVARAVSLMDPSSQAAFFAEYQQNSKSLATAYILWLLFGLHYLYFRKIGVQFLFWLSSLIGIGIIWWLIDLFRLPSIRREYLNQVARTALQTLEVGATFTNPTTNTPANNNFSQARSDPQQP